MDRARADLIEVIDCRYGRMMVLKNDRYMGRALKKYGEYSESEVDLWRQIIQPDWVVVDAGANIGAHTVALARLVPQGCVLAFEPLRFMYHMLCGNLALNALTNARAMNMAVGSTKGQILCPMLDYTIDGNYGGLALGGFQQGIPTPLVPLDAVCQAAHFIKADVEGMEGDVLCGAQRLIHEFKPVLYLENNPSPAMPQLIDQVHALGYACYWHYAPHFNPGNYRGDPENSEPGVVSFNMLCMHYPDGDPPHLAGLQLIPR